AWARKHLVMPAAKRCCSIWALGASSADIRLAPTPSRAYAMGMPALQNDWTVERALALPEDGNRYEVLDGELFVTPAPSWTHQSVLGELYSPLRAYVKANQLGWALFSPADLVFSNRRLVQPDLFVVPRRAAGR